MNHSEIYNTLFKVGDKVRKSTGDYTFEGVVVAIVIKRSKDIRYVVEDDRGLLLILNSKQLCSQPSPPLPS